MPLCRSYTAALTSPVLLQLTATSKAKGAGIQHPTLLYGIESDDGDANNEKEEEERWFS